MGGALEGVRQKLIRAKEHLEAFEGEVAIYAAVNPYSIVRRLEQHIPEKSGRPGVTWRVSMTAPPPPRLSVLAGDCLHNLRSALDHLAWILVLDNGGTPSDGPPGTRFPIIREVRATGTGAPRPLAIRSKVGGASARALALVEDLQPYRSAQDPALHPLAILNALSNADKHRTLVTVVLDLGRVKFSIPRIGMAGHGTRMAVTDSTIIYWVLEENPAFDRELEMRVEPAPNIGFLDARGVGSDTSLTAVEVLHRLTAFTREDVVQRIVRDCLGSSLVL
jgi:hypothetical protein